MAGKVKKKMKTKKAIFIITVTVAMALVVGVFSANYLIQTNPIFQAANKVPTATTSTTQTGTTQITINDAATAAQNYIAKMGNPNLQVKCVQEYTNVFYAQVVEKDTGAGAFELSINKMTGVVLPMQGPTMMWDTKYGVGNGGMMGYLTSTGTSGYGMMGTGAMTWLRGTPTTNMAINMNQAMANAQQYLTANYAGSSVGQVTTYYGYYTMQVVKDGNVVGMMSIYGANGQAMYYTWCGTFMRQLVFS